MAACQSKKTYEAGVKRLGQGQMLVSKNGIYLVSRWGQMRSFQVISWAQIAAQLEG